MFQIHSTTLRQDNVLQAITWQIISVCLSAYIDTNEYVLTEEQMG